ncbi:MAG: DUF624 domain-containing protein [Firmicutes bacterium]|nr:DUF624 domain-containing protein [Bacillota bacterium]
MGGFFNMDGPFMRFGNALADIMILSVIWLAFSVPLVTMGASTTALFYVTTRRVSDKEGYILRDFWGSFKSNFKKATILWIGWCTILGLVVLNIQIIPELYIDPTMTLILQVIQFVILAQLVIISIYMFPLTARFEMGFRQIIKSAFFMGNRHLFTTISTAITGVAIVAFAIFVFEPVILVGIGIYAYVASFMIMRVFKKYRPDMDEKDLSLQELAPLPDFNLENVDDNENSTETLSTSEVDKQQI